MSVTVCLKKASETSSAWEWKLGNGCMGYGNETTNQWERGAEHRLDCTQLSHDHKAPDRLMNIH